MHGEPQSLRLYSFPKMNLELKLVSASSRIFCEQKLTLVPTRNVPCFPALRSTALSQAAKRFPLCRRILADDRANTFVQHAERLDFELGQRRMVEPRDEHNAHRVSLVPRLMLEGIVEDEA